MSKKPKNPVENTGEKRVHIEEFIGGGGGVSAKINLSDPESIRREMSAVYRLARANKIDPSDATKLVYMLAQIGKLYEIQVIEKRLQMLEDNQRVTR